MLYFATASFGDGVTKKIEVKSHCRVMDSIAERVGVSLEAGHIDCRFMLCFRTETSTNFQTPKLRRKSHLAVPRSDGAEVGILHAANRPETKAQS